MRALGGVRIAVIGPGTAAALRGYHLEADLIPAGPDYSSESLAAALLPVAGAKRVLLARADRGRELLRERLSAVAAVEQVTVYRQVDAVDRTRRAGAFAPRRDQLRAADQFQHRPRPARRARRHRP